MSGGDRRRTLAVVAARGGSKGIPHKNLIDLCGKPLIAWTVLQAGAADGVDVVAVSSDSDAILAAAEAAGAVGVRRPDEISGDLVSSEAAWLHALEHVDGTLGPFQRIVALQATSPIREASDIDRALDAFEQQKLDSLLSVCEVEDYFNWRVGKDGPEPINYDYHDRRMRQQIEKRYLENGSFYVFIPSLLREQKNRLGGRIGMHVMERQKMFQIDRPEDIRLCAAIMSSYGYA
ncbi:MAG: acylneuraminate cytidylyltransferase family protein [Bradyrhizobium sp.]|uniref:acylneuraminate cytidylyltransferase family protein n=1 Tax=Bradyrhizobium sp. TaxID=376 RepID=UPI001C2977FA|nr:acylneuraminate cytidylyltransferase family protein [Bradyrhizobium sp.]MBU6463637.1 acylneuraminate cytidylyltransferase family protein [Pseudomonadota bacterium]MDE2066364.1 acylneuraminate cytidylyltransferase family protein [Bradyrhizobium sp.]MDE2243674.1 acylneuraminate cytidylyltransferase family protein [Bradyrhizobium sp.]MDE2470584.1 acylneuraminate cytidylyltransferase family protein [Bradyrhizobium sp.]